MSKGPGAPLRLTLYDPETSEPAREFTRGFIPWKFLKVAIRLSKRLGGAKPEDLSEETVDEIAELVVAVFGDRFTAEELAQGADVDEMMTVLRAIVARARGLSPAPNPPAPAE